MVKEKFFPSHPDLTTFDIKSFRLQNKLPLSRSMKFDIQVPAKLEVS